MLKPFLEDNAIFVPCLPPDEVDLISDDNNDDESDNDFEINPAVRSRSAASNTRGSSSGIAGSSRRSSQSTARSSSQTSRGHREEQGENAHLTSLVLDLLKVWCAVLLFSSCREELCEASINDMMGEVVRTKNACRVDDCAPPKSSGMS